MVLRVRPMPTRFPTSMLYTLVHSTLFHSCLWCPREACNGHLVMWPAAGSWSYLRICVTNSSHRFHRDSIYWEHPNFGLFCKKLAIFTWVGEGPKRTPLMNTSLTKMSQLEKPFVSIVYPPAFVFCKIVKEQKVTVQECCYENRKWNVLENVFFSIHAAHVKWHQQYSLKKDSTGLRNHLQL